MLPEKVSEALLELRELANEFRCESEQVNYGYFLGGDPRRFSPDPDCSTEAERAAHKAACEAWERGEREPLPGPHEPLREPQSGQVVGHITRSGFGIGVNTVEDEFSADVADRLERILDRLERGIADGA